MSTKHTPPPEHESWPTTPTWWWLNVPGEGWTPKWIQNDGKIALIRDVDGTWYPWGPSDGELGGPILPPGAEPVEPDAGTKHAEPWDPDTDAEAEEHQAAVDAVEVVEQTPPPEHVEDLTIAGLQSVIDDAHARGGIVSVSYQRIGEIDRLDATLTFPDWSAKMARGRGQESLDRFRHDRTRLVCLVSQYLPTDMWLAVTPTEIYVGRGLQILESS